MADGQFFGKVIKNASFWNRPIPGTMWVDKSVSALGGGMKTVAKGSGKLALAGLAVVGGLYAASSLVSSFRDKNEYKAPERPDPYADLPPLPPVYDMGAPQQETMMGLAPVTDGKFAQQVMSRRGLEQGMGSPEVG